MRTFTVTGNYGDITVDWDTGRVVDYSPDPDDTPEYVDIFWFHVEEFRTYYRYGSYAEFLIGTGGRARIDILDIGFTEARKIPA